MEKCKYLILKCLHFCFVAIAPPSHQSVYCKLLPCPFPNKNVSLHSIYSSEACFTQC
jgi:hypothetical protein